MRQRLRPPHPRGRLWSLVTFCRPPAEAQPSTGNSLWRAHSRIGVGIEVSIKIAQAVIAEAEPHRRRFPNFACGRSSRSPALRWPLRGALPPAAGQGKSETPPAARPWACQLSALPIQKTGTGVFIYYSSARAPRCPGWKVRRRSKTLGSSVRVSSYVIPARLLCLAREAALAVLSAPKELRPRRDPSLRSGRPQRPSRISGPFARQPRAKGDNQILYSRGLFIRQTSNSGN